MFSLIFAIYTLVELTFWFIVSWIVLAVCYPFDKARKAVHWCSKMICMFFWKVPPTWKQRVEGLEHIEYLPVMDYRNASISKDKVTSMDVNKAIQRSLTKACARHGLGLYIYAGEDLPSGEAEKMSADDEADFELACQRIKEAKNRDELVVIYNDCPKFHSRQEFVDRLNARQEEFNNN